MKIKRIKTIPAAFSDFADTFNEAAEQIEKAVKFTSNDGSVKVNESDAGFDLSAKGGVGGGSGASLPAGTAGDVLYHDGTDWTATPIGSAGGLPSGYGPESWSVYDGGVVTTRNFLTDNPD
jgi:hypothetical protein